MHVHIINNTWQAVTEKKKHSTLLPKKYHRSAIICTRSTGTFPLAFSQERPLSQQSVPRSTWRYQDICVHTYRWCVRALNARQYATLPRLTPTERHVVMYDVWVFPAHPSLCAALPDLTAAVLSSLVTAALPNGRYQCCQLSCLGCLCRWKTVSFIGEGLACTCYQPQRVQDGQCKYRYEKADIVNNTKATQVSPYDVIDV